MCKIESPYLGDISREDEWEFATVMLITSQEVLYTPHSSRSNKYQRSPHSNFYTFSLYKLWIEAPDAVKASDVRARVAAGWRPLRDL